MVLVRPALLKVATEQLLCSACKDATSYLAYRLQMYVEALHLMQLYHCFGARRFEEEESHPSALNRKLQAAQADMLHTAGMALGKMSVSTANTVAADQQTKRSFTAIEVTNLAVTSCNQLGCGAA